MVSQIQDWWNELYWLEAKDCQVVFKFPHYTEENVSLGGVLDVFLFLMVNHGWLIQWSSSRFVMYQHNLNSQPEISPNAAEPEQLNRQWKVSLELLVKREVTVGYVSGTSVQSEWIWCVLFEWILSYVFIKDKMTVESSQLTSLAHY